MNRLESKGFSAYLSAILPRWAETDPARAKERIKTGFIAFLAEILVLYMLLGRPGTLPDVPEEALRLLTGSLLFVCLVISLFYAIQGRIMAHSPTLARLRSGARLLTLVQGLASLAAFARLMLSAFCF